MNKYRCISNLNLKRNLTCISVLVVAVFAITNFDTNAFAEISLLSYDSTISPTDRLLIMGTIEGEFQSFNPIKLIVYDPLGNIVYQPNIPINGDGEFKYLITPTLPRFDDGIYIVEASQEDLEGKTQLHFTVSSNAYAVFDQNMEKEIVPEFGMISIMILTVAIISIIGVSAKSKLMMR